MSARRCAVTAVLGGMSPATFLRDYWQKRPLLIRQAVPGFGGILDRDAFLLTPDGVAFCARRRGAIREVPVGEAALRVR